MKFIEKESLTRKQEQVLKFLEVFFSAEVKFVKSSIKEICDEMGVEYKENERRHSYCFRNNKRLIVVYEHNNERMQKNESKELFRILLESDINSEIPSVYYDNTSVIISEFFNDARNNTFIAFYDSNTIDVLSKTLISYIMSTAAFKKSYIFSWLEKLEKLSNTTFEGVYFSTGVIFTRRMEQILANKTGDYKCFPALNSFPIIDFQNDYKRCWYLADGDINFYIADKKGEVSNLITIFRKKDYFDNYFLKGFIKGQDIVFRSLGRGELSIINKDGIEIIKRENEWKIRSVDSMIRFFIDNCSMNNSTAKAISYYIIQCSRNHKSSIFWVPKKENEKAIINKLIIQKEDMQNANFYITKTEYEQLFMRIFTSDGANIISKDGKLLYCGAIVNLRTVKSSGLKGTGESAAEILGMNGVCVKISQDGKIKIFKNDNKTIF